MNNCLICDGNGRVFNNGDSANQWVPCFVCEGQPAHTEGPWFVIDTPVLAIVAKERHPVIAHLTATDDRSNCTSEVHANAHLMASAPCLLKALVGLADLFAIAGENSVARFDRLAAMFYADTGYLAPGKDHPAGGLSTQEGRDALNAIYDDWYSAKVDRARAAIARATGKDA